MALTTAQIQNAYVAFFNRPADVAGLQYWSNYAGNSADLLNTFAQSAEYTGLYANMNATQLVSAVYQNLFGRAPEVSGLTYWVNQLDNGALKIGNIAEAINKGAQGTDSAIITNKVAAATAFTAALDTTPEIVAYASANSTALSAVKSWLNTVTSDVASVTTATGAALNTVLATVQNNSNQNVGQTFTLTAGIDSLTGTSGNDTFNAYATGVTSTGTDATTLGANDTINGGAGTDTLNIEVATGYNEAIQGNISNIEKVFITGAATLASAVDVTKLGAELQEVWEVNTTKDVTGVTAQTVGLKNVNTSSSVAVSYGATTTSGKIALENSGQAGVSVAVQGAALATLSVIGSVKAANATTAGTVTLTDDADGAGLGAVGSVKTLNLGLSTAATVDVAGLDKLETIVSTGAGNLVLDGTTGAGVALASTVKSVTTGAGNDTFTLATGTTATVSASADTGAGNDIITVNTTGTAGTVTVKAGEGDDAIIFSRALNVRDSVDGGAGSDTLTVQGTALIAEDYEVLAATVKNVETLKFAQAMAGADASKLSQFSGFSFTTDSSSITKVANAQTVSTTADVAVTAAGYVAKGTGTPAATATTYAGDLKVVAQGGAAASLGADGLVGGTGADADTALNNVVVTANASSVNLTVSAGAATAAAAGTASFASLTGDVQTATVNLVNSVNAATTGTATADALATFSLATDSSSTAVGGAYDALGGLTSLTLTGNGSAVITAGVASNLKTIDASGMTGVAAFDATKQVGGLAFTGSNATAETIKLGGGKDVVTTVSSYDKMDVITGLNLVKTAAGALDTAKSDDLVVTGYNTATGTGFAKATVEGSTFGLALVNAAASATGDQLVFTYGGNTYAYVDRGDTGATANGVLDNNDVVIQLTGALDLDMVVAALNA